MSGDQLEIKVNVINQLQILRQSTFKDKLSFLDEDVQNAQRAKSTEVKVYCDYSNKQVIIQNNGKVLENPQALFSIAESEWDEDIKESESPFGIGFFSNITVSDHIEIFSGDKHIIFNISEMLKNNTTEIEIKILEEEYRGFKLVLSNFNFNDVSSNDIKDRVKLLGKYIHELDIYYNDELQDKKDLTEGDSSTFSTSINDDLFKGWIALGGSFCMDDIKLFYKGRFVTKLDNIYYIKGEPHLTDKALNLTSPDRKNIINDSKFANFKDKVMHYVRELATRSFLNGNQKEIEPHLNAIEVWSDKEKLKENATFLMFDTESENDSKYLNGIALAKKKNDIRNLNQYEVFLKQEASQQAESLCEELSFTREIKQKAPEAYGIRFYEGSSGTSGYKEEPTIDEDKIEERAAISIEFGEYPVFWLEFDEIVEMEKKFNIANHYKLKIIVSRNKIESKLLEMLSKNNMILHLSKLTENTDIRATVSNTELSNQESRALMLLDMISRIVGFNSNIFAIGDLMVLKDTKIEALSYTNTSIEDRYIAIYDDHNEKIYMDRTVLDKYKLRCDLNENIDLEDFKFIIMNLKEIVRELSLVNFGAIKKPHDLYDTILNTLAAS